MSAGRSSIASIRDHLRLARQRIVDGPAYARVGLRAIVINEVVGAADHLSSRTSLATLAWRRSLD
jgi:hypothetical protein